MPPMLVDTDVLSAIMRRRQSATAKAAAYLSIHNQYGELHRQGQLIGDADILIAASA